MRALVHAPAPPVGSVDVTTAPFRSTATHCETDAHETAHTGFPGSMLAFVHVLAPPVGLVEVRAFPDESTATQSETNGHMTPSRNPP